MVTIEYIKDEDGNQQVVDLVEIIVKAAEKNEDYAQLAALVAQVFDFLKEVGVPPQEKRTLVGERLDSTPITLAHVVKELENHPPLMEARANWRGIGAFRAIFFYTEDYNGYQTLYFTKAVIKESTYDAEFEKAIELSENMLREFFKPE